MLLLSLFNFPENNPSLFCISRARYFEVGYAVDFNQWKLCYSDSVQFVDIVFVYRYHCEMKSAYCTYDEWAHTTLKNVGIKWVLNCIALYENNNYNAIRSMHNTRVCANFRINKLHHFNFSIWWKDWKNLTFSFNAFGLLKPNLHQNNFWKKEANKIITYHYTYVS